MRRVAAILLLCILSWSSLLKVGIMAWYEYNKDYIAQNLCENRDKPAMKCCGKCYLRKQLAKVETKKDAAGKPLPAPLSKIELPVFILPPQVNLTPPSPVAEAQIPSVYTEPFAEGVWMPVLHPPG